MNGRISFTSPSPFLNSAQPSASTLIIWAQPLEEEMTSGWTFFFGDTKSPFKEDLRFYLWSNKASATSESCFPGLSGSKK